MTVTKTEPSSAISLTVEAARLVHAGTALFDALDFTLPAGRTTCLLGPSGVGKTSLLRFIAGLEGGGGRVSCSDGKPLAGRLAWMAQQDLLLPWATVRGNVGLGQTLRGARPDHARIDELLQLVGLDGRGGDLPAVLSGGMRQRAALARTLMEDRPVILMDEPFSALDAITRHQLQDAAAQLLAGRTVLLVTHDPLEALRLGHRVHVMAGRPARLDAALEPPGAPPRDPREAEILALQGELLARLTAARESAA